LSDAAIHDQFCTRQLAAVVGCEKHHGLGDLVGVPKRRSDLWSSFPLTINPSPTTDSNAPYTIELRCQIIRFDKSAYVRRFSSEALMFNREGDCLATRLRPGNVHSAEGWAELLLPEIERQRRLAGKWSSGPMRPSPSRNFTRHSKNAT
jgi:hypothetical protein